MTESFRVREIDMILKEMEGSESRLFEQYDATNRRFVGIYITSAVYRLFLLRKADECEREALVKAYANIFRRTRSFAVTSRSLSR
jgi:hypothetical protein